MTIPDDSTASASPAEGHPPLVGADYLRAHVAFESASDQQDRIRRWLVGRLLAAEGAGLDVASVGAGSGILDVPLIERVSASKSLRYQVFEPVAEQCEAFAARAQERLADRDRIELAIECAGIERAPDAAAFDHVLAIHSTYYFDDVEASLEKLLGMTREGGELLVAVAPREAMNRLAEPFWGPQVEDALQFDTHVIDALERLGAELEVERIDAELVLDPADPRADDVASFLIQTSVEALDADRRAAVHESIRAVSRELAGGALAVPHPVSMLAARR
jgi:SAM-dependent methyltransferase